MAHMNPVTADEKRFLRNVGHRLRELREAKGWTLEQAEEQGSPSWRYLQRIESGRNVTLVTLRRVAKLYKIPLNQLLSQIE